MRRASLRATVAVAGVSVSKGEAFACAVTTGDVVQCWGTVEGGVLGTGVTNRGNPAPIALPQRDRGDSIVAVSAGATPFACVLRKSGRADCWGENEHGETGNGMTAPVPAAARVRLASSLVALSAGEGMACGLASDGRAFCWGTNEEGQLGAGDSAIHRLPVPVRSPARFRQLDVGAAGGSCGVAMDHRLWCWGRNDGGQLGTADDRPVLAPQVPAMLSTHRFDAVSVGNGFACGLTTDARVLCWGSPAEVLGAPAPPMVSVVELPLSANQHAVALSSGFRASCLLTSDHHVSCWGSNAQGVLGRDAESSTETGLGSLSSDREYTAVSVGAFGCGITTAGALECWGARRHGATRRTASPSERSRVERIDFH